MRKQHNGLYVFTIISLAIALLLVEITSFDKMVEERLWADRPGSPLVYLASFALIALMLAAICSMANPNLDKSLRSRISWAGSALLFFQAYANCIISFVHVKQQMPAGVVTSFFANAISQDNAERLIAVVNGGILSFVAVVFWQVLAIIILNRVEEKNHWRENLHTINEHYNEHVAE